MASTLLLPEHFHKDGLRHVRNPLHDLARIEPAFCKPRAKGY
jgi:hypothetical protein